MRGGVWGKERYKKKETREIQRLKEFQCSRVQIGGDGKQFNMKIKWCYGISETMLKVLMDFKNRIDVIRITFKIISATGEGWIRT